MKTKKSSLSLILALVMVFVMASGALATVIAVDGVDGGTLKQDITAIDEHALWVYSGGKVTLEGNITTTGNSIYGAWASASSTFVYIGGVISTNGRAADGVFAYSNGFADLKGDIATYGQNSTAIRAQTSSDVTMKGNVTIYGESEIGANGQPVGRGLSAAINSRIVMTDGSVIVSGDNVALYASVGGGIELSNVVVEGVRLAGSDSSGTIEAKDGSTLTGDILHSGFAEGTLELILSDSVWNGSVEASGDIGVINVDLGNSQWNVTGDSNTNGKITGDADSKIDFNGTTDTITVIIDNLTGEPAISMKPDDKLIIKNADGKFESSNPDVIEVIETENGVEIISKGDGEAELKYSYIDEDGKIKEATIKVVSGAGSQTSGETSRGGGSSNCNTGVGAALFALFGLAFIQKRK